MYRVTLIEGINDMVFDFENLNNAYQFVKNALEHFHSRETTNEMSTLVVEIEKIDEVF